MKKYTAASLILLLGLFFCLNSYAKFDDVSLNHWAYSSIQKMEEKELINGFPDGSFRPNNSVSRAEYAKMLTTVFGFTVRTAEEYSNVLQYVPDSNPDSWYYPYICAALPCMFAKQTGFNPDGEMTREDAAHSLSVLYGYIEPLGDTITASNVSSNVLTKFSDSAQITDGKKDSVALAVQNGLMQGKDNGKFDPKGPLTRAEICVLFMRAMDMKGLPPQNVLEHLQGSGYKIVYEPTAIELPEPPNGEIAVTPDTLSSPSVKPEEGNVSSSIAAIEKKVWELTNQARTEAGIAALQYDEKMADVARAHSADMDARGFFEHNNPDEKTPFDRMKAAGFRYSYAAENIAWNQRTPEAVMQSWMNSPGHRANILNENLTHIGIGLHIAENGSYYWTQNFYTPLR